MSSEIPYVYGNKILISKESIEYNIHTWQDKTVSDLFLVEKFYDLIEENFSILDIGAQSGAFTLLSKFFPKTKWYSFEPDPTNYNLLVENLSINHIDNVTPFNYGLSNKVGNDELMVCKSHRGLNSYGKLINRFDVSSEDTLCINTPINTIDNLFFNERIDLIKIDTEGCEYNILQGGKEVIMKNKPKILLEYYESNLNQFGNSLSDLHQLIDELDYEVVEFFSGDILIQSKL